jgi:hypothetical protein
MPIGIGLQTSVGISCPRKAIVDERYVMTDEDIVFDMHTFANEGMTGNFTILSDGRSFLNLHKRTHLAAIVDATAVGVYEIENLYILANFHVVEGLFVGVDSEGFHESGE